MTVILACDVGTRRTGVALGSSTDGTVMALTTLAHQDPETLKYLIMQKADEKKADVILLGLPLLPGGEEGSQSSLVRAVGDALKDAGRTVEFLDERYTTSTAPLGDGDAKAACELVLMYLSRKERLKTVNGTN